MPNWCENRVRLSDNGDNSEQFDRLCEIMDGPNPFNTIFPMPDFKTIPNEKGELPIKEVHKNDKGEVVAQTYNFPDVGISWFYDEPGMEFAGYLPN